MALEVTSSTVSGMQKTSKPAEIQEPKQQTNAADVASANNSMLNERQVVARTEGGTVGYERGSESNVQTLDELDKQRIQSAVKRANSSAKMSRTKCEFAYHEETNRVSIKIRDKETDEVIREIPSEEALELIERMWEVAGMLIDEKA